MSGIEPLKIPTFDMASENKKRKMKNAHSNHGFALKESTMKLKRLLFFNASNRRKNNKLTNETEDGNS